MQTVQSTKEIAGRHPRYGSTGPSVGSTTTSCITRGFGILAWACGAVVATMAAAHAQKQAPQQHLDRHKVQ